MRGSEQPYAHPELPAHTPHSAHPAHTAHAAHPAADTPLSRTEARLDNIIGHDAKHEHMGEVYKELESLRQNNHGHFGKDLQAINKHLHDKGLLPNMTIVQDHYTGDDQKDHVGYSLIAYDKKNPGNRVGSEVSTSHPQVPETQHSRTAYQSMYHGRHSGFAPGRYSAEGGRGAAGGYDENLRGQEVPEGDRKDMIDKALELAGVPISAKAEAAMNRIITRESGWDPNIVNTWDSNARKGDPSKGLMQVIHSTFEKYKDPSLPDSQTDPMANMVAALRYMGARYGHGNNARGLMRVASRSGGY